MFVVSVIFDIAPTRFDAFVARVRQQAADSLALETDCHRFDVCTDDNGSPRVLLYELYVDAAAFDAHLASAHFKDFDAAVAAMVVNKTVAKWRN